MEGGGEEEDPFGSLIGLCQITSSQELELQNCPFAREFESFPDAFDSLPSQFSPETQSELPPGIIMVSPPETDSEDQAEASSDKSTPREIEEFQTPPEHHVPSSQEDQLRQPIPAGDDDIDGSDGVETVGIESQRGENRVNFGLGKRGENLGFLETEELEAEVEGIEGFERELKKFRVFEGDLDEPSSKKIRVSEEKTVCIDETEIREKVDDVDEEEELIYLDVDEIDEGIGLDEDKIVINVDSAKEELEVNDGVSENGKMQKNGGCVSDGENDSEGETEKVYADDGNPGENVGGDLDCGENNGKKNEGLAVEGFEENRNDELRENGEEVSGCRNIEEIEEFRYKVRCGVNNPGKEKVVSLHGGERNFLINGDSAVEASEEGVWNNEVQKYSKQGLACRNIAEIDQFRYKGSGDGGDQCWKEVVQRRRELPLSLREKGNDVGGKEGVSKVDVKNVSWKELLDAVAVVLGKVNDGSEDVDFLEAAKRRGMTFPQPRWI